MFVYFCLFWQTKKHIFNDPRKNRDIDVVCGYFERQTT
jgi:hypothetical protein